MSEAPENAGGRGIQGDGIDAGRLGELPALLKLEDSEIIRAAGCLVYREIEGRHEVLVVHRPLYDDWDLPKGKRERGESDLQCAIRETREETGFGGLVERELAPDHYLVRGRDKVVRWWLMRCTDGAFETNTEVDEIRWLEPDEAQSVLSYGHARSLIDEWRSGDAPQAPEEVLAESE